MALGNTCEACLCEASMRFMSAKPGKPTIICRKCHNMAFNSNLRHGIRTAETYKKLWRDHCDSPEIRRERAIRILQGIAK